MTEAYQGKARPALHERVQNKTIVFSKWLAFGRDKSVLLGEFSSHNVVIFTELIHLYTFIK